MGNNLTNQYISASFQGLVQISGSELTDGTGSLIPSLDITASNATTAVSSSHALNADNAVSASYAVASDTAVSASHALIADSALAADTATSASHALVSDTSISASHAVAADTAISSSHALNADNAVSSSYAVTASFALNVSDPTLQDVTDAGATTTNNMIIDGPVGVDRKFTVKRNSGVSAHIQSTSTEAIFGTSGSLNSYGVRILGGDSGAFPNSLIHLDSLNGTVVSQSLEVKSALTASGLIYPTADGTTGQVVTTDGSGNLTFSTPAGGGAAAGLISGSAPNSLLSANYTTTDALAEGSGSIAIGDNAQVTGSTSDNTVVIGKDADSKLNSVRNVILGYNARMTEDNRNDSVIIGANANGYQEGVAIGADAFTIYQAVAVGKSAYTNDNYGIAIGAGARANNTAGIAIGSGSLSDGNNSVAIGQGAHATAEGDVVINNGVKDVFEYDKSADTTTIPSILAITGITDVSASIAAAGGGGAAFPFVGDAEITGSLDVEGWTNSQHLGISGSDPRNMAMGTGSLANVTSGVRNTAFGSYYLDNPGSNLFAAGYQITNGNDNSLYGVGAGCRMTGGSNNAFFGVLAGGGTTTGNENAGFGQGALRDNNGSGNVGIGKWAGYGASGQNGVMVGYKTGFGNSGWRNIILGGNCVGQGASLTTHDKLVIGQDLSPTDNLIYGYHGADTTPGDRFLTVKGLINAGQYSAAPTGAGVQAGSIYFDTTTNKLRCYDGTTWNDLF